MNAEPCFLYAIATVRNGELCAPVKVGISSNPQARLNQVQTGSPFKLAFALLLMLDDRAMARKVEQTALHWLRDHALAGEWLDMHPLAVVGELVAEVIYVSGYRGSASTDAAALQ